LTSLFVEQPNMRLKLTAALCKTVLKLGSPSSTNIAVTLLNHHHMVFNKEHDSKH